MMFYSKQCWMLFSVVLCYFDYPKLVVGHEDLVYSVQYTIETFSEEMPKRNHFVMFYAPWCGHCKRLAPIWEQLAEMLNEDDGNVRIAKVDCTTDGEICSKHDVTGYPTLKFFKKGETTGEKFKGTRDLPSLTTFINEQLREVNEEPELQTIVSSIELSDDSFEDHISQGKHFVKFYAPWCGHCQQLAPIWQEVSKIFQSDTSVSIAKLDCTKYKSICTDYDIMAYPSLLWFENGKKIDKYIGSRTVEDLVDYIKKMTNVEVISEEEHDIETKKMHSHQKEDDVVSGALGDNIRNGVTVVKFFAPWCGHCKSLAPIWEDLIQKYKNSNIVKIIRVDCTTPENEILCNKEKVDGFPTIFLYKDGRKISEYKGSRSLEDLSDFIESHITHDKL